MTSPSPSPAPAAGRTAAAAPAAGRPLATLSLDLDNEWSYRMTHGDPGWRDFPSYLDTVVPRVLEFLAARRLTITVFVVGRDASLARNHDAIRALAGAGHEMGNHSFRHEPWLHRSPPAEARDEIARAEDAITAVTGARPVGFRGPGYSLSPAVLEALAARGYLYDASTLPTFVGPLARAVYFRSARLDPEERARRSDLFGAASEGLRPLRPYRWDTAGGRLLEIPVTTLPGARMPIHVSYLLALAGRSPAAASGYFRSALALCRMAGVEPSILLHPLDFLGGDDVTTLSFFPGMAMRGADKVARTGRFVDLLAARFDVQPLRGHAAALAARPDLPVVRPGRRRPRRAEREAAGAA